MAMIPAMTTGMIDFMISSENIHSLSNEVLNVLDDTATNSSLVNQSDFGDRIVNTSFSR